MPAHTSYRLNPATIVASVGGGVFCVDLGALGRTYPLSAARPGPETNRYACRLDGGGVEWRADLPSGAAHTISPVAPQRSPLIRVDIMGGLEQRAGYHDECGGWSDGHDAVADRLCAAFAEGDVFFVIDSPGGAAAGLQQGVERAMAAKAEHGRYCTVFADEMIGSAGFWWACTIGDEIFTPPAGQLGSIGARGEHTDISGMLAQEGIKKTYFADPPEKVALAPEFPLSPVGAMRGNRDVTIAADAFRAAVCSSPIGLRNGLTPEDLKALGADMLTGKAAIGVLADGVESFGAVVAYALALAESEPGSDARMSASKITGATSAKERAMPHTRMEGDEKPEKTDDGPESAKAEGLKPDGICKACGMGNPISHKFCAQCGESMEAKPLDEEEPAPPSSKPPPPGGDKKMAAPDRMPSNASLASIVGATVDTPLAIKTAAIALRQVRDAAAGVTGHRDAAKIVGGLLAVPERLERGRAATIALAERTAQAELAERKVLAHRLVAAMPTIRSKVFADLLDDAGGRRLDTKGKPQVRVRSAYGPEKMPLATLRTFVESVEKDGPAQRRNPFAPDEDAAKLAAGVTPEGAVPTFSEAQMKRLEKHPDVTLLLTRGSAVSAADLAKGLVATNPRSAQRFLAQTGAPS